MSDFQLNLSCSEIVLFKTKLREAYQKNKVIASFSKASLF